MKAISKKSLILIGSLLLVQYLAGMNCSIDVAQFKTGDKPYVDIMLRIDGTTITFDENEGKLSSKALVQIIVQNGDELVGIEKYYLNTENVAEPRDLMDLRRFFLSPGAYGLDVKIIDQMDITNVFGYKSSITIQEASKISLSDAILASVIEGSDQATSLCRNGLCIEPLPYLLITHDQSELNMYQEVYIADFKTQPLIHKTYIEKTSEDSVYINQPITKYKKVKGDQVGIIVNKIDCSKLTSGEYTITTSIIDKSKKDLYSKSMKFVVNNKIADLSSIRDYNAAVENSFVQEMDSATLSYALRAISPISNSIEQPVLNYAARKAPVEVMRFYLFKFWNDAYPQIAESAYNKYMEVARVVDKDFQSNVGYGFETDRGYIYLKYGAPNKMITVVDEPNTPPYEIWYYSQIAYAQQTDVRFIFYDPLQVNNFELLHSTAYGERSNPTWEGLLYKFTGGSSSGFGTRASTLFNEF